MCQRITCSKCGKPSFRGCGRHVESVLGDVRPQDRCACRAAAPDAAAGGAALDRISAFLRRGFGGKGR
jgi:hypothetical protein